jgi:hypothetical protein
MMLAMVMGNGSDDGDYGDDDRNSGDGIGGDANE